MPVVNKASSSTYDQLINPVLIAGCIIILVSFAVRASFGLFQLPIALEFAWPRESFSLAIAIQNLFWGIGQPIFGAFAERYGDRKAILGGGAFYVIGLVLSAYAITPGQHQLLEMLVGFGIAGTGFGVILAVVSRAASDKHRSMALGIATAAGSAGQIVGPDSFAGQGVPVVAARQGRCRDLKRRCLWRFSAGQKQQSPGLPARALSGNSGRDGRI
ncbi:hypothetical protein GCM10009113_31340 [Marinobacter szutsaonensis]